LAGYSKARIAEDIKRELAAIVRELKDPRVQGILTVVRVDVSRDASFARVYISAMEGIETAKLAVSGLESAKGLIRQEIGGRLRLRATPELRFIADDSVEQSVIIAKKLEELKANSED
jgi:ribosome-binding factor A